MVLLLVILLLILILGGVGIASAALHVLLWIAIILAIIWVIGFFARGGSGSGRRWYRW